MYIIIIVMNILFVVVFYSLIHNHIKHKTKSLYYYNPNK